MGIGQIKYDPKYSVDTDVLRRLNLSFEDAQAVPQKELKCPICGFRLMGISTDKSGIIDIKCQKCKFSGYMNLAYFRRIKKGGYHLKFRLPVHKDL